MPITPSLAHQEQFLPHPHPRFGRQTPTRHATHPDNFIFINAMIWPHLKCTFHVMCIYLEVFGSWLMSLVNENGNLIPIHCVLISKIFVWNGNLIPYWRINYSFHTPWVTLSHNLHSLTPHYHARFLIPFPPAIQTPPSLWFYVTDLCTIFIIDLT